MDIGTESTAPEYIRHKTNECVMYKNYGICRITDIRSERFGDGDLRDYYVLRSVSDEHCVVYIPTDSELTLRMRHVLSKDEIDYIIDNSSRQTGLWVNDGKLRAARFMQIILNGDRAEILWIIKALSIYRNELAQSKKHLCAGDERVLAAAEKAITDEFSFVLGIDRSAVIPYIVGRLGISLDSEGITA